MQRISFIFLFIMFFSLLPINLCAQIDNKEANKSHTEDNVVWKKLSDLTMSGEISKMSWIEKNDTIIRIEYLNSIDKNQVVKKNQLPPAYYLNGVFFEENSCLQSIDTHEVEKIDITHDSIVIGDNSYYGKVLITTKEGYETKFLSLNQLRTKYIKPLNNEVVYLLDEKIINAQPDNFLVNDYEIYSISVEKLEYSNVELIYIYTKFFERKKPIYIRGNN